MTLDFRGKYFTENGTGTWGVVNWNPWETRVYVNITISCPRVSNIMPKLCKTRLVIYLQWFNVRNVDNQ